MHRNELSAAHSGGLVVPVTDSGPGAASDGPSLPRPESGPSPPFVGAAGTPSPLPLADYTVDTAPPGDLRAALVPVGRTMLYSGWHWQTDG